MKKLTARMKVLEVHDHFMDSTESFTEENIGMYLAYLYPAILRKGFIELNEQDKHFLTLTQSIFPKGHYIWEYIHIV